jgi:flagellar motor protein MotB
MDCTRALENRRYCGPVFVRDDYLVQRVSEHKVVIHRLSAIHFSATAHLQRRAAQKRLNDLTLTIYYVGAKRIAYLREVHSGFARRAPRDRPQLVGTRDQSGRRNILHRANPVAAAIAAAITLTSCTSNTKLVTPNGSDRVAINSPQSLTKYQDIVAREDAITLEKSELQRKVDALTAQVAALQSYVLSTQKGALPSAAPLAPPSNVALPRSTPVRPTGPPTTSEAVVAGPDRVVFRVSQRNGETEFAPSASLEAALLKAAREATSISIRGRTDSASVDDLETRIALSRALRAREFLVSHGADANKIRLWYRAAGGFIADNSTAQGRAMNRRVEIEARGLPSTASAPLASDVSGAPNP